MDWEIFDLDGDEIVIRRSQTAKPWGDAPSSRRLPRSAGSVNRPRRCEQVQELIRFCGVEETDIPSPRRRTIKQDASCDGNSRKIRAMASVPNLRGAPGDRKYLKPKLRLRAVLSRERSPEGSRFPMLQSPKFKDSTTSLHTTDSPPESLSSPTAGCSNTVGGRGADCECYFSRGAVLAARNSMEESRAGKDKSEVDEPKRPVTAPRFVVNPWISTKRIEDAYPHGVGCVKWSTLSSHRQSASDEWGSRASTSFEDDAPSTPATSAFSSVASPAQSLKDRSKSFVRDSNQLDPRLLPQRSSSKMVQEITGSTRRTRLSPQASREYLISRIQDLDTSSSTNDVQSKRNGRHWPSGGPSFQAGESRIPTGPPIASKLPLSGPGDRFFEPSMRNRLMSVPSVPTMNGNSSAHYHPKDVPKASDLPLANRSRSIGGLLPPLPNRDYDSKPLPQLPAFARTERNMPSHTRNMATVHANPMVSSTQTSTSLRNGNSHQKRLHLRIPAPISIPERPPDGLSAPGPRSPRIALPSSPPNIPLPADPPVPPGRASSQYRKTAPHVRNASAESLVDPALALNCSTQDTRRTIRSRPALRRNVSDYTMSNQQKVPEMSWSVPSSLVPWARSSRVDQPDDSATQKDLTDPTGPAGDRHGAQNAIMPSTPSHIAPTCKPDFSPSCHGHSHGPSPLSRRPSHSHALSPPTAFSSDQIESRLAFLEQQNKMLQAALIAALGAGVGVGMGHDADSAGASGSMKGAGSADANVSVSWSGSR